MQVVDGGIVVWIVFLVIFGFEDWIFRGEFNCLDLSCSVEE